MRYTLIWLLLIGPIALWSTGAAAGTEPEGGEQRPTAETGGGGSAAAPTIEGDQNAARPLYQQAEQAYMRGEHAQAAELFQRAYGLWHHPTFQFNRGQALARATRYQDALAAFQQYVSTYASSGLPADRFESLVHIQIAECLHQLNRRSEATAALRRYLELNPQGDLAPAVRQSIERSTPPGSIGARDPQTVQAARRIHDEAAALHQHGSDRQAAERFLEGYRQYSEVSEFLYNAASCYRSARMWVEAVREYERYVMTACPAADAFVELAQCYHEQADYERAIEAYQRYLQREPRGTFASDAREYVQSMTSVLEMSRQRPPRETIRQASQHFDRGRTHYEAGRYRQALQEFSQAHDLAPTRETQFNIGMCYYRMRDWMHTLTTFENYLRDGDDAEHTVAHLYAAQAEIELERPGNAQRHIQDYLTRADAQELPNEERDRRFAQQLQERVRRALAPFTGGS